MAKTVEIGQNVVKNGQNGGKMAKMAKMVGKWPK